MLSFRLNASELCLPLGLVRRWGRVLTLGGGALCCSPRAAQLPPAPPAPTPVPDACALSADSTGVPDTLTVALSGSVDPAHAPVPVSGAERMVFRQLYETLLRFDCTSAARPGLAASWSVGESGTRWTFTLRAGAAFWDGTPVTARDVIASWTVGDTSRLAGATLEAPDDRTLVVRLPHASSGPPLWLGDAPLAVTRSLPGRDWPLGTGTYTADTAGGRVVVAPFSGRGRAVLVIRSLGATDARDWLDRGADLLITDDPAALSYAANRAEFATRPLPWDRTYVLLALGAAPAVTPAWRASLARDAVRVEARPAVAPDWWTAFPACLGPPPTAVLQSAPSQRLIVYSREDATARDLAARLVALEGGAGGPPIRAAGLGAEDLAAALSSGRAAQVVLAVPQGEVDPCRTARRLVALAPWLTLATQIVPLVDSRRRVVWRRGAAAFDVDWDGTLHLR